MEKDMELTVRKTHKGRLKIGVVIALILGTFAATFTATAAFAADSGYSGTVTVNGVGYQNRATVNPSSGSLAYMTWVKVVSGTAPAGWIGNRARLIYASNGAVCAQTGMYYSNSTRGPGEEAVQTGVGTCGSNNYYSWGVTEYRNSNGTYGSWYTPKSPNITY